MVKAQQYVVAAVRIRTGERLRRDDHSDRGAHAFDAGAIGNSLRSQRRHGIGSVAALRESARKTPDDGGR